MKILVLAALALVFSISIVRAEELTVTALDQVGSLPCSVFQSSGDSLKEGVALTIPLSVTNNTELFTPLGERAGQCQEVEMMREDSLTSLDVLR